ncbi:carbohydrate-binding family 9-like protein [Paraflavitalea pollutisoli]|uniref:carbohydrate-binding family 9-like protein n=1 Tax=Paraflavitalea pollutisoli TaxID=3034143 RepID=UPI0023EE0592|nr:carbohydrate-binding family 9-like protein [Paraflavitalea sp. H1-2-19X]
MKELIIKEISIADVKDFRAIDVALDALPKTSISESPWAASYPYHPMVQFALGYGPAHLFLKYYVTEKTIRAVTNQVNGMVWQDSCVEFFITLDEVAYYNIEINCIGTALVGFGPSKNERNRLPAPVVEEIGTSSHIRRLSNDKLFHWELTACIPLTVFLHHQPVSLKGKRLRGNFYKCGDLLPEPHYLSWQPLDSATPNFHLPAAFGSLHFV